MKHHVWSIVLRVEILLAGIFLSGTSLFAVSLGIDDGVNWGIGRIGALVIGGLLLMTGIASSLPRVSNFISVDIFESGARYLNRAFIWCFLILISIEFSLRIALYNGPVSIVETSWFGSLPSDNSVIFYGKEGYSVTRYGKLGEIHTPFQGVAENIIVLGDSFTEGWQVSDDLKYTSVAETVLRGRGRAIDIRNLGRSSLSIADYVSWIPNYQSLFHAQVIVVQLALDDFVESFHQDKLNYFIVQEDKTIELVHKYDVSSDLVLSVEKNNIFPQLVLIGTDRLEKMNKMKGIVSDATSPPTDFDPELIDQQLQRLLDVCNGVPLILILNPGAPQISENQVITNDPAHKLLIELILSRHPQITIVDPLPEFQEISLEGYFPKGFFNSPVPGQGHWNSYGQKIVGKLLAEAIEQVLP